MEEYRQLQQSQVDALQRERDGMESNQSMLENENRKLNSIIEAMKTQNRRHEEEQQRQMSDIAVLKSQITDLQGQLYLHQSSTGQSSPEIAVVDLVRSTQTAKRYKTVAHIDELSDDDSKSNTFPDDKDGDGFGREYDLNTDTESDSRERAEVKRRKTEMETQLAMQTQLAHLQVQQNQNLISMDDQSTYSEPELAPSRSSFSASSNGLRMSLIGDGSSGINTPMDTPVTGSRRSLITKDNADKLSAEELKRQKREMQDQMAHLMASHSLRTYGSGDISDVGPTVMGPPPNSVQFLAGSGTHGQIRESDELV